MTATASELDLKIGTEALKRIAADLSMITDRTLSFERIEVERASSRAAGKGRVHISFKIGVRRGSTLLHGAFLVPLPEAIALACRLLMVSEDQVAAKSTLNALDTQTKDALLEIGNFVGGACDAALRALSIPEVKVRSEGCQGVRADVRPAFRYDEGAPLVTARARATGGGAPFDAILMLPALD